MSLVMIAIRTALTTKDGDWMGHAPAPLNLVSQGSGPDLLFIPGMDGTLFAGPFVEALAQDHTVRVAKLPGWGDVPRDPSYRTFDDLAYALLDVLDGFDDPVPVVGCSTGAWLATEAATKSCAKISKLALVAPVGIRFAEPTERSYLDLYAEDPEFVRQAMYGKATQAPDLPKLSDEQFLELARAQEAVAYYAWEPYMHNRSLLHRLHRVTAPTLLVVGEDDGFLLREDHLALYRGEIATTETVQLPGVGHRVEEQAPAELAKTITSFISG